ncbi:hydantoinase B/oxoprolinase family protein [Bifidobacterium aquikefiri]|uniref:hydantoinase B/oxoprolinase family protein n=1 Tax=Bifidobacterium aquikefiri TaxID=1653207 RepID=UPI0039EB48B0
MSSHINPITFSVLDSGIRSAVAEMKAVVLRTAYSNLWREAGDLSCGLLLPNGEIVAQGVGDIPIHLASMSMTLLGILKTIPLEEINPGDVLLQNNPYAGNNHMPDFFMAMPVFSQSKLLCFTAVRGHYVDIGSPVAGSYNLLAKDLYGEGIRIPPVKIYKKGVVDTELLSILSSNVRNSSERMGDMNSQYAGCSHACRRVISYCKKYSFEIVDAAMKQMVSHSEVTARKAFENIPDGSYQFEDFCDGDGNDRDPIKIACKMTIHDDSITVDFTGSSHQCVGPMNSPLGVTYSAVCFAIKAVTEPHSPSNSGSYRPISIIAPKGSIVNPLEPAPVVAGNHETSSRIADVILGCLSQALPDLVPAAGTGSATVLIVGREGVKDDAIMYEVHGAGQGGAPGHDGSNARRTSIGNTGNTPNEILELTYPVQILEYSIREDTGGSGKFRGGNGIQRKLRFTEDSTVTIVADRDISKPYGLFGGSSGANAVFELTDAEGKRCLLSSKTASMHVAAGSELRIGCAAGGGYGNPKDRSLNQIQRDIDDGYISPNYARREYGINIGEDHVGIETRFIVGGLGLEGNKE